MKMETSLTAPFAGRVRRVLSGTNVQVGAQTPLLQLEPVEDEAAERAPSASTSARPASAAADGEAALGRCAGCCSATTSAATRRAARWPRCGRRPAAVRASTACWTCTPTCAHSRAARHDPEREMLRSPQEYLHAFLRSLDAKAERLPERFVALLQRALAHYGVEGLDRTPALEEACYRLFLAQQRADLAARRRAGRAGPPAPARRRARRAAPRGLPRGARPPGGGHRAARPGRGRPRPPAAQSLLRPAADRPAARGRLRGRWTSTSPRWWPAAATATRTSRRSSRARSCWRRC